MNHQQKNNVFLCIVLSMMIPIGDCVEGIRSTAQISKRRSNCSDIKRFPYTNDNHSLIIRRRINFLLINTIDSVFFFFGSRYEIYHLFGANSMTMKVSE